MNVKISPNDYLLLRALHQGQPAPELAPSFLTLLANKVDADLLAVAEWLTLIVRDKTSRLGYRPSHLFIDQILLHQLEWDRPVRDGKAQMWEREVLDQVIRDSLKNRAPSVDWFATDVGRFLGFIGLTRITSEGDWVPTDRLLNLVVVLREHDANQGKAKRIK